MEYERERILSVLKGPVAAKNHEMQMVLLFAITYVIPEYGIYICTCMLMNMYVYTYVKYVRICKDMYIYIYMYIHV